MLGLLVNCSGDLNIFGKVDHDWSWSACSREVKSFMYDLPKLGGIFDEVVVLGAMSRNPDGIAFLKCVASDEGRGHLTSNYNNGNRIHHCVSNSCDRVRCSWTGGDQDDPGLACGARVPFGSVNGATFLPDEDVANSILIEDRIVDRENSTTRVAKDQFNAKIIERFD
jgi:hypothetical protein